MRHRTRALRPLGRESRQACLARIGRAAESTVVGALTELLDPAASMGGEVNHAMLLDRATTSAHPVELHLEREGLQILVMSSGVAHDQPRVKMELDSHRARMPRQRSASAP